MAPDIWYSLVCDACGHIVTTWDASTGDDRAKRTDDNSTALCDEDIDSLSEEWRDQLPTCWKKISKT